MISCSYKLISLLACLAVAVNASYVTHRTPKCRVRYCDVIRAAMQHHLRAGVQHSAGGELLPQGGEELRHCRGTGVLAMNENVRPTMKSNVLLVQSSNAPQCMSRSARLST